MVAGLFPYAASGQPLAERPRTGALWARLGRAREAQPDLRGRLIDRLIDWRNLTQVLVSMDPRYGPIYNAGGARSLYAALVNHGYAPGGGAPVVLIGYNGGAQVCLGAATYLKPALAAPLAVVSLGGVVGSDRGLESVDHMYHLYGPATRAEGAGCILALPVAAGQALPLEFGPRRRPAAVRPPGRHEPDVRRATSTRYSRAPDGRSSPGRDRRGKMLEIIERSTGERQDGAGRGAAVTARPSGQAGAGLRLHRPANTGVVLRRRRRRRRRG